jgi:hypothetical protein
MARGLFSRSINLHAFSVEMLPTSRFSRIRTSAGTAWMK